MSKLTNSKLRRMIMQELTRIVGEDALVDPGSDAHVTGASDDSKVLLGKESVALITMMMTITVLIIH